MMKSAPPNEAYLLAMKRMAAANSNWMKHRNQGIAAEIAAIKNGITIDRLPGSQSSTVYPGTDYTGIHSDFTGDWRAANNWVQFDLRNMRYRSRQLERGNHWAKSFKKTLLANTVGSSGFHRKPVVTSSRAFGDSAENVVDESAQAAIKRLCEDFGKKRQHTANRQFSEIELDNYITARLAFDGEVLIQKIKRFEHNDFGFTWKPIDVDYLDSFLNKTLENGNIIRMGVELHGEYRFPVAYWLLNRRPNDQYWTFHQQYPDLYTRVPAEDIIHIFVNTEDAELVRGVPWMFAAMANLHKMGKFEEAALINAVIGASKMGFFKKMFPSGMESADLSELTDPDNDSGEIIDACSPGEWQELPWGVEPVDYAPQYPNEEMEPFHKVMMRGIAASLGSSYMSLTGDVSDANFSNLRAAKSDEQEEFKALQAFLISNWKEPAHEELIFRSLLRQKLVLPIGKFDKFKKANFTGRRWPYVNPVDDLKAKELELSLNLTSVSALIRERGGDPDETFAEIEKERKMFKDKDITPIPLIAKATDGKDPAAGSIEKESERGNGEDKSTKKS